mgnify:CR=1 FL=1
MTEIEFHSNIDIDRIKWDKCISQAPNSRIYALSWYLDIIFPNWSGLVYGNYAFVMPVLMSKKWGIKYSLQTAYAQQHGIFPNPENEITETFINKFSTLASYIKIALNADNDLSEGPFEVTKKSNFVLSLDHDYENLRKAFSKHNKRYTNKAEKEVSILDQTTIDQYIKLKEKVAGNFIDRSLLDKLKLILLKCRDRKILEIKGAYDTHNELCAAAVYIHERKRITYLNGVSTDNGKQLRAMYAIFNEFLKQHAGSKKILDFEGSSIPGVARFFKGFGAHDEQFSIIHQNRLPFILKWLVK